MTTPFDPASVNPLERYDALLKVLQIISVHPDLAGLVQSLDRELHSVLEFTYFDIVLYDAEIDKMIPFFPGVVPEIPEDCKFQYGPGYWVWEHQVPYQCTVKELEASFPAYAELRKQENLKVFCAAPLTTTQRKLGVVHFASTKRETLYSPEDLEFMQRVAAQIAIMVDSSVNLHNSRQLEQELARERNYLRDVLEVTNAAVSKLDLDEMLNEIATHCGKIASCDSTSILLYDAAAVQLQCKITMPPTSRQLLQPGATLPAHDALFSRSVLAKSVCVLELEDLRRAASESPLISGLLRAGVRSFCGLPLISRGKILGVAVFFHTGKDTFRADKVQLLTGIAAQVSTFIDNALIYKEISLLHDRITSEKLCLEEELRSEHNFNEMIGQSAALQRVFAQIEQVADSDATVLIQGETGTGKELVARAIHDLSYRRSHVLLKLNCSAIPSGLLESEMFGYERGSFTGALAQKLGRMELADKGTLFLDEVGDMPLELQPKLLRALQEREIERIGGKRPIHVDIRLIAATNRNLQQMVTSHLYRSDLYYRLNVFPIVLPPLRERKEDIPLLVQHFTRKYARKMNRKIDTIPAEAMERLKNLPWPGNIRELENMIERAVIITQSSVLNIPIPIDDTQSIAAPAEVYADSSISSPCDTPERELILRALYETGGQVAGPSGAAAKLGMARSTLFSRLNVLQISAKEIRNMSRMSRLSASLSSPQWDS